MKLHLTANGSGPDLVLLHGWAMNSSVWASILPGLEANFRVTCVDLPGHGRSDFNAHWSLDDVVDALASALPKKCRVLGWSLGGMLGLRLALKYPRQVERLILLASSAKFTQSADWLHGQPVSVLQQFSKQLVDNPAATIKRFLSLQTQGLEQAGELNRRLRGLISTEHFPQIAGLESGLAVLETADLRDDLREVACPVLQILGENDQLIPIAVAKDAMQLNANLQQCIIKKAGHTPFLSHPEETLSAINKFSLI